MMHKILNNKCFIDQINKHKSAGKKIVFTNGCFDIFHFGHLSYLREAKKLGDILAVAINADKGVTELKGEDRPIFPAGQRSEIISELQCVNYVTIFDDPTPIRLIKDIKPDVLVKGGDYSKENIVGSEFVASYGGEIYSLTYIDNLSSTSIFNTLKAL